MSRRPKINRAINKYGASVTLQFKPVANAAHTETVLDVLQDDWPDPNLAPTTPAPPDVVVKAIVVPEPDVEYKNVQPEGFFPSEMVQAFFLAVQDLNTVLSVVWQGNTYRILQQKNYELEGEILAQEILMVREVAATVMPHG